MRFPVFSKLLAVVAREKIEKEIFHDFSMPTVGTWFICYAIVYHDGWLTSSVFLVFWWKRYRKNPPAESFFTKCWIRFSTHFDEFFDYSLTLAISNLAIADFDGFKAEVSKCLEVLSGHFHKRIVTSPTWCVKKKP
jgi:hypothetical protein